MKKIVSFVFVLFLLFLVGCQNEIKEEKINHLEIKEYLRLIALESEHPPVENKRFVIDKKEIIHRALSLENFLEDYPNSKKKEKIQKYFDQYLYFIYYGIDGSPLFHKKTGKFSEESLNLYLDIISSNPESTFVKDLSVFIELLEKNHYIITSTSKEYRKTIILGSGEIEKE